MGTSGLDHIGRIVACNAATYHEWKEEIAALLSGLSLGQYLTQEIDYNEDNELTIKESNRCHYLLYSTLAMTQQAAPAKCKPNLLPGVASRVDLLWTHLEQKFGLEGNHSVLLLISSQRSMSVVQSLDSNIAFGIKNSPIHSCNPLQTLLHTDHDTESCYRTSPFTNCNS